MNANQVDANKRFNLLCSLSESRLKDLVMERYKRSYETSIAYKLFSLKEFKVLVHESQYEAGKLPQIFKLVYYSDGKVCKSVDLQSLINSV